MIGIVIFLRTRGCKLRVKRLDLKPAQFPAETVYFDLNLFFYVTILIVCDIFSCVTLTRVVSRTFKTARPNEVKHKKNSL